jgi:quercetin dioxygenase-like cupin family protein
MHDGERGAKEIMVMKRLVLILSIAAGIGIVGLAAGRVAVDRVAAQEPQFTRQEIALGRLDYHEAFGGPALVVVQQFTFDPGARAGWHTHPGPASIVVTKGEMAFYGADGCRTVYSAGSAVIEQPYQVHEPRNETAEPLEFYVTFIVPVGPALRSPAEAPTVECGE